jgi:hypothetical protein
VGERCGWWWGVRSECLGRRYAGLLVDGWLGSAGPDRSLSDLHPTCFEWPIRPKTTSALFPDRRRFERRRRSSGHNQCSCPPRYVPCMNPLSAQD